jgi:hypothetical protein
MTTITLNELHKNCRVKNSQPTGTNTSTRNVRTTLPTTGVIATISMKKKIMTIDLMKNQ